MKDLSFNIARSRVGRHLTFWLAILMAVTVAESSSEVQEISFLVLLGNNAINIIAPAIAAYFLNYYLLPKFFQRKRYFSFLVVFCLSVYVICVFARIVNVYVAEPLFRQGSFQQETVKEIFVQLESLLTVYFPSIFFVAFAMTLFKQQKAQLEMRERNMMLEKEKAETELNFLKAQIHPHFLFNTLNNLYLLTLKKSEEAPDIIIKLSEILDYILYKGGEKVVPVEKEIRLLDNYISLEKLRYGDRLHVTFRKEVDDIRRRISPLLLLSIVENAFKHGASSQLSNPEINIELIVEGNQLKFQVYNTKGKPSHASKDDYREGIGVSNIKRQLALIYADYSFRIQDEENFYIVNLSVDLDSIEGNS